MLRCSKSNKFNRVYSLWMSIFIVLWCGVLQRGDLFLQVCSSLYREERKETMETFTKRLVNLCNLDTLTRHIFAWGMICWSSDNQERDISLSLIIYNEICSHYQCFFGWRNCCNSISMKICIVVGILTSPSESSFDYYRPNMFVDDDGDGLSMLLSFFP